MPNFYKFKDNPTVYNQQNQGLDANAYAQQGGLADYSNVQTIDYPTPNLLQPPNITTGNPQIVPTAANGFGTGVVTPISEYDQFSQQRYKDSQAPIDTEAIRKQKIAEFQTQIDATNQIFTNLTAQANQQGRERLGQSRALAARSGNLGNPRGQAQQEQVQEYNNGIVSNIGAEQQAKIAGILAQAQTNANTEIVAKQQAKEAGATSYLDYLKGAQERKSANSQAVLQSLLAQGLKLEDIPQDQFVQLAASVGMTPNELQSVYKGELAKAAKAQAEVAYQREKDAQEYGLKVGQYQLDVTKENNLNTREGNKLALDSQRLNFDVGKFSQEFELNSRKTDAEINKINFDIANGGASQAIDPEFAAKYGLPLGLTKGQLAGVIPGQQEKLDAANTELTEINKVQDLINYLKTNPAKNTAIGGLINIGRNIPGTAAYDYTQKFNQLKAILSLDNAGKLKGSGAISDSERKLLADSATSLNLNGSSQAFVDELTSLESKIGQSKQKIENLVQISQTNNLFQQFEGGSGSTNPKAQPVPSSPLSIKGQPVDTKTLASAVLPSYPQGSTGGQCVTFLHKLVDFPPIGDGLNAKKASVDNFGIPKAQVASQAQVGMILISNDNPTYGHASMINAISADGKYARVTESNYKGVEKVSHDRVVRLDDPRIYGAIIPNKLKTRTA